MSGKGGVGKSTVSTNLAVALAQKDYRVGLIDADIHGPNIPKMLGIEGANFMSSGNGIQPVMYYPNLKVASVAFMMDSNDDAIIWRGPLKHSLIRQFFSDFHWGELDFLVVDLPPGTGDEPLSVAQTIQQVAGVLVVRLVAKRSAVITQAVVFPFGSVDGTALHCVPHYKLNCLT